MFDSIRLDSSSTEVAQKLRGSAAELTGVRAWIACWRDGAFAALALALSAAVLAGCTNVSGGGFSVREGPPTIPRTLDGDFTAASEAASHLAQVNFDPNVGQGGMNVKIGIMDSGIDARHPTFSGRTIADPTALPTPYTDAQTRHGTLVAMVASGAIDKEVYGVAYRSDLEFLCCVGVDAAAENRALDYLGTTSDAFVVNHSWGVDDVATFAIESQSNCEAAIIRALDPSITCAEADISFNVPTSSVGGDGPRMLSACANPDSAAVNADGTKERICVFAAGNEGWQLSGVMKRQVGPLELYRFNVSDLLGDASPISDADKQTLRDSLYVRPGGYVNLPAEDAAHTGHFLVVAALETGADRLAPYSNGCGDSMMYCLAAPGSLPLDLCDTDPSGVSSMCGGNPSGITGTSFAAPIVSGAAALLKSTYPNLPAPSVVDILLETATNIGSSQDFGRGKLNVVGSLQPVGEKLTSAGESLTETVIQAGPSLGSALSRSTASFGLFDSYKRPYLHFVSGRVSTQGSSLDALDGFMRDSSAMVNADVRQRMGLLGTGETRAPAAVSLRRFDDDSSLRIDSGFENCSLGCLSSRDVKASSLVPSSARAWSEQHVSAPFGRMGTVVEVGFADDNDAGFSSGGLFYAGRIGESSLLRLEAGAMVERETFMGSGFGGALELGAGRGQYVSAQLGTELGSGAFSASYTLGKERAGRAIGSLVTEVSDATYDGYRLAYGGKDWEFHHTVPLAATGGGMRIESVGGYTGDQGDWSVIDSGGRFGIVGSSGSDDWSYRTDSHWIDFSAAGRERRTGIILNRPLGSWNSVLAFEHVSNSPREGHVGGEARVAVGFELDFD